MQILNNNHYPKKCFFLLNCCALIMSLLIVFLSTHIRLGEAGLGCSPWPDCYAQLSFADGPKGLQIPDTAFKTFRSMHRSIASILGLNILVIMLIALWFRKETSPLLPVLMFLVVLFSLNIRHCNTNQKFAPCDTGKYFRRYCFVRPCLAANPGDERQTEKTRAALYCF